LETWQGSEISNEVRHNREAWTSGGGSKAWGGVSSNANKDGLMFFYLGQWFMCMQITPMFANVAFYDIDGNY